MYLHQYLSLSYSRLALVSPVSPVSPASPPLGGPHWLGVTTNYPNEAREQIRSIRVRGE